MRLRWQIAYELDHAIRQIVSRAVSSEEVIDIFTAAGLKRPDIPILSDDFLAEVKGMPQKNLAVELLEKLLKDEIKARTRKNLEQRRSFSEMLEASIRKYKARAIESAKVIEELIALAKKMREAERQGTELGLTEDERAFCDALEVNDSAVKVLGDETLKIIARELVDNGSTQREHWLDDSRECSCKTPRRRPPYFEEARLSAGQARKELRARLSSKQS